VHQAAKLAKERDFGRSETVVVVLAALLHDVGKPLTTELCDDGKIRSRNHHVVGVDIAREFLKSIRAPQDVVRKVLPLVEQHMRHIFCNQVGRRTAMRLANDLHPATIRQWAIVVEADHSARPPLPRGMPESAIQIVQWAEKLELEEAKPKEILMGRHLLDEMEPGPAMGQVLRQVFEAQLDGEVATLEEAKSLAVLIIRKGVK
jgi:tRNA nucleotidyltransferase (CCA-adding enzyme)